MTHRTFDEQIANFNRVVSSWDINQEYKVALLGMIVSLGYEHEKSITPEPHWIPVTERLPEEKDAGILKKLGVNKRSDHVLATVKAKGEYMTVQTCTYDGVWHWDMKYAFPDYKIIAWMPLPEPFKGVTR